MARLTIDSGEITADQYLEEVPPENWRELMQVRRSFLRTHLPYDCRELLRFVEEAEEMYVPLGFESVEDMVRRGLELEPEQVAWAVEGLKRLKPNEPIPYLRAQELGKREIGIEGGKPGPGRGHKTVRNTRRLRGDGSVERTLARLDRDGHDELAAKVRSGEMSANAAAELLGWRKKLTSLELIQKLWAKLDKDERKAHLDWTLNQCATCGRKGTWAGGVPDGTWCDACCEDGARSGVD